MVQRLALKGAAVSLSLRFREYRRGIGIRAREWKMYNKRCFPDMTGLLPSLNHYSCGHLYESRPANISSRVMRGSTSLRLTVDN